MDEDFAAEMQGLLILFGMLLVPAIIILAVFLYVHKRRSSFRQKSRRKSPSREST